MKIKFYGKLEDITANAQDFPLETVELKNRYSFSYNRSANDAPLIIDLAEDEVIEVEFADGTHWLLPQDELDSYLRTTVGMRTGDEMVYLPYLIKTNVESNRGEEEAVATAINILVSTVDELTTSWLRDKIEHRIMPKEGLFRVNEDFTLQPFDQTTADKENYLLLLHGTASSTSGSFLEMSNTPEWQKLCQLYPGRIIALEHRTLSKSPIENLADLLSALPKGANLHLLSYSRGGIIAELLCRYTKDNIPFTSAEIAHLPLEQYEADRKLLAEIENLSKALKLTVEHSVRVACPTQGTKLLANRLDIFLNVLLNLLTPGAAATFPPLVAIKELLVAVAKQRSNPAILPGIEVMKPGSAYQKLINSSAYPVKSVLSIIAGKGGKGGIKRTLLYLLTRFYFWEDNDYVVDTDSMFSGQARVDTPQFRLFSGKEVFHFTYFKNQESRKAILEALNSTVGQDITGFTFLPQAIEEDRSWF
ncbi:MAG: hypothetical protein AAGJ93_09090, partial [Bacteroidota bacterium]